MSTELELSLLELGERHGFHAVSFGFNTGCSRDNLWSANVHWAGYSRVGNPCESGMGPSIASALQSAIERANNDRTPASLTLPDEPLADLARRARLPLADIQFIAEFAAFCRGKGEEAYDFCSSTTCAVAQFGYPSAHGGEAYNNLRERGIPQSAFNAAVYEGPFTFSALADRLEALIAGSPEVVRL